MKKKILYSLIGTIILLTLTNPSLKDFKEHIGYSSKLIVNDNTAIKYSSIYKENNYFLLSLYSCEGVKCFGYNYESQNTISFNEKYFGILGNFFKINSD